MDPFCKKLCTPHPNQCLDRLSSLSNDILHLVFSYLDFVDVVRTSVLSKRWKYVWMSAPYLNFDMSWFIKHNYNKRFEQLEPQCKFWDFIKWALLIRDDESQIIRICLDSDNTMTSQLNGLLRVAAKLKVQELHFLDGDYAADELEFPHVLCETLTMLTLSFRDTIPLLVSKAFQNIGKLKLTRVLIWPDVAKKLFSTDCIKLESLYLEDCQFHNLEEINVSGPHLREVTIVNASTYEKFWVVGCFDSKIRICAPNLTSFCYIGPMVLGFTFLDMESLESVTIRLLRIPRGYEDEYKNHFISPGRFVGLNCAKTLTLSSLILKYLSPTYCQCLWDTFILENLSRLVLEIRPHANCIEGLICLLKFTPNLEALAIGFKEGQRIPWLLSRARRVIENTPSWESRVEDIICLSYHVKVIQLSNFDGSELALQLAKFLLQNSRVLEKLSLLYRRGEMTRNSFFKLLAFPKASSKFSISFPEYGRRIIPWFDEGDSDPEADD